MCIVEIHKKLGYEMLETVSSVGRFYHISKHQKMTSTSQQGIVCECTTNSYEFMLSSPNRVWKLYKLAEQQPVAL